MIGTTVSVSQQYLLASKARSKLLQCASTGKNKDYDLRILVGHANLLDKLMNSIDSFTYSQKQENENAEYVSSDDEDDDEEEEDGDGGYGDDYEYSGSESESDSDPEEETIVDPPIVEHYGCTPRYSQSVCFPTIWEEKSDKGYVPLKLRSPGGYSNESPKGDESEEEDDQESTDGSDVEQDLSMMKMTMGTDITISV